MTLTPVVRAVLEGAGSPAIGAANADVVVVVFTDYQCGVCKRTDAALRRLLAHDPNVRVIFKDWPVFGARSDFAARAALAAHAQGRYGAMHWALMEARGRLEADEVLRVARAAGLDVKRLQSDMARDSAALAEQLSRHGAQAWSLGLEGTPGYLVGPFLIQGGLDDRSLIHAVRRARDAGPPV